MQRTPLVFAAQVTVDHGIPTHPIDVTTEPAIMGRPLAELGGWLTRIRDDLADGTYTVAYSVEDGIKVEGAHTRSVSLLRTYLAQPMADLTGDLFAAFDRGLTDETIVAENVGLYAEALVFLADLRGGEVAKPGFVKVHVGCPHCATRLYGAGRELSAIAVLPVPEDNVAERDAFVAAERRRITDAGHVIPEANGFGLAFLSGASCTNPFATAANAKLQAHVDQLAPEIERQAVAAAVERLGHAAERTNAASSALRETFGL